MGRSGRLILRPSEQLRQLGDVGGDAPGFVARAQRVVPWPPGTSFEIIKCFDMLVRFMKDPGEQSTAKNIELCVPVWFAGGAATYLHMRSQKAAPCPRILVASSTRI